MVTAELRDIFTLRLFTEGILWNLSLSEEGLIEARNLEKESRECRRKLRIVRDWANEMVIEADGDLQQQQERIDELKNVVEERQREIVNLSNKLNERRDGRAKDQKEVEKLAKQVVELNEKWKSDRAKYVTLAVICAIVAFAICIFTDSNFFTFLACIFVVGEVFYVWKQIMNKMRTERAESRLCNEVSDCTAAIRGANEDINRMVSEEKGLCERLRELRERASELERNLEKKKNFRDAVLRCSESLLQMSSYLIQLIPLFERSHTAAESLFREDNENRLLINDIIRKFELAKTKFREAFHQMMAPSLGVCWDRVQPTNALQETTSRYRGRALPPTSVIL